MVYGSKKWGENKAKKDQAEDNLDKVKEYEKVDSAPSVIDPFKRMRKKS
jgi:hypothetical protein